LSSLDGSERAEAVSLAKKTIALAANVRARAIVLHMGEAPIDLDLQDRLYEFHDRGYTQTKEYCQTKERLVSQRVSLAQPYVDAAKRSLQELSKYSRQKGIMLGLETRFHFNEIPNIEEMAELLDEVSERLAGYWHDVGHAEVTQQPGFGFHEEWLSRGPETGWLASTCTISAAFLITRPREKEMCTGK
jgi:sugar phosphate isomerase/epimerase